MIRLASLVCWWWSLGVWAQFRRPSRDEVDSATWARPASAYSANLLVWLKHGADILPSVLEAELRLLGAPLSFLRPVFGKAILLFKNDLGEPTDNGPLTIMMLRQMVCALSSPVCVSE